MELAGRGSISGDHDAGGDDRDDAGRVDDVRGRIAAVGDDQGGQDLERRILGRPHEGDPKEAHGDADHRAADTNLKKTNGGVAERWLTGEDGGQDGAEDRDPGAVVEE